MSFVKDFDGRQSLEREMWEERSWTEWYDMLDELADELDDDVRRCEISKFASGMAKSGWAPISVGHVNGSSGVQPNICPPLPGD